jgi:hypothetical protein
MQAESAESGNGISLSWGGAGSDEIHAMQLEPGSRRQPAGLDVLAFYLRKDRELVRIADTRRWRWGRLA